ncbi:MAG: FkbM family methyltransferase [Actinobacteria bacterium]|nr:FkbM family methyltransferase [Actinomycetota bacterium]
MKMVAEHGVFEPEVMAVLNELLTPESVALDIGANIGVLTLVMARATPRGTVYAFEPGGEASHYLRLNIDANALDNVVVEETAVLDVTGRTSLEVAPDGSAWSFVSENLHSACPQDVAATRLDDWMQTRKPGRVDLMKLDIESCELRALTGAHALLARFRPIVIAEYNPLIFRQLQDRPPAALYRALRRYSRFVYALLPGSGAVRVVSQRHLDLMVSRHGLLNLLASPRRLAKVAGENRNLPRSVRHFVSLARQHNRRVHPDLAWFTSTDVRLAAPTTVTAQLGDTLHVDVDITNNSPFWLSSEYPAIPIYCGHRWFTKAGAPVGDHPHPHALPAAAVTSLGEIPPGGRKRVTCRLAAPAESGAYVLRFGIVQTQYLWIDDIEPASGARVDVEVTEREPSASA